VAAHAGGQPRRTGTASVALQRLFELGLLVMKEAEELGLVERSLERAP